MNRLTEIINKQETKKKGEYNLIPFKNTFPRLSEYLPGFLPGSINLIFGASGTGKSKFSKLLTILIPYMNKKVKYKTIYFALEETKEQIVDLLACTIMWSKYNNPLGYMRLHGYKGELLNSKELEQLNDIYNNEIPKILENLIIIDDVYNPTGLFLEVLNQAEKLGEIIKKDDKIVGYKPYDKNLFVNIVVDHQQEFQGEKCNIQNRYLDQRGAISKWYSTYCKNYISKIFNFTVINIGQENIAAGDVTHFKAGRLEPDFSSLGNNREIVRVCHNVVALFNPYKLQLNQHRGRKVTPDYRSVHILKSRFGEADLQVAMSMHGPSGLFHELPKI